MNEPSDIAARTRALDPDGSFLVQAPAGSGKTELLVRRMLALLAVVDEPEEVLAITFTRKAAGEMRRRTIDMLTRAAAGGEASEVHAEPALTLAKRVLVRDADRGWNLLDDPRRLNLRTVDALNRAIMTARPIAAGIGGSIDVTERPHALYREAARRFVDHRFDKLKPLILHLDNNVERLETLLASLLAVRDQWSRCVPFGELDEAALRVRLEASLATLVRRRLTALCECMPPCMGALPGLLPALADNLDAWAKLKRHELKPWQVALIARREERVALPGAEPSDRERWQGLVPLLLTGDGVPRMRVSGEIGCPGRGNARALGVEARVLAAHGAAFRELLDALREAPVFVDRLAAVSALPATVFDEADWERLRVVVCGLGQLVDELHGVFAERGRIDHAEAARCAVRALSDDGEAVKTERDDTSCAVILRPRHVLVDEFQDVSRAQVRLLERLVVNWRAGDGRTLFVVGDPMQSIYRFREGDVSLFLRAREHGIGGVSLEPVRLTTNFRASPALVDWVNEWLGPLFPVRPDTEVGAVPFEHGVAFRRTDGNVHLHVSTSGCRHDAARQVAGLAERALAIDPGGSVGILLRTRSQAREILPALCEFGIPHRVVEIGALGRRPMISDLIALAFSLRYPHDRLHWLALLRGPLCGLTLDDMHAFAGDSAHESLLSRLDRHRLPGTLSVDGHARLVRLATVLRPAIDAVAREPLVPWLESVWLRLGGPAACEDDADETAAEYCFAHLAMLERAGELSGHHALGEAFTGLKVSDALAPESRVEVMTLHKAKGLEFDHVIVPGLDRRGRHDEKRLLEWHEDDSDNAGGLLLAPIDPPRVEGGETGPLAAFIRDLRSRADAHERLRLLYVACTRARRRLHLCATVKPDREGGRKRPSASSLLAPLHADFIATADEGASFMRFDPDRQMSVDTDRYPAFVRVASSASTPDFKTFRWLGMTAPEPKQTSLPDHGWRDPLARDVGTIVHRALQRLVAIPSARRHLPDARQRAGIARQLRTLGVGARQIEQATERVVTAVANTLDSERGRWILDERHADARSEWALTVPEDGEGGCLSSVRRVVVDRAFIDADGTRWIIDYKSGHCAGADAARWLDAQVASHRDQLARYARALHRVESRRLRVGLWFPAMSAWREIIPPSASAACREASVV